MGIYGIWIGILGKFALQTVQSDVHDARPIERLRRANTTISTIPMGVKYTQEVTFLHR
jgi:hypothetical protein